MMRSLFDIDRGPGGTSASLFGVTPGLAPAPPPAELMLLRLAVELGAVGTGGALSDAERCLVDQAGNAGPTPRADIATARAAILAGADPLGEALSQIRPALQRRDLGAFYTQPLLSIPMLDWVLARSPERVVDPGCGSGRFAAGAVRRQPDLKIVAVDIDPLATLLTRATLAVLGARGATILQADYTSLALPRIAGRTAFVGNPPYVRHHRLPAAAKAWAVTTGRRLGQRVSALAGLHAHFFLATAMQARSGDLGCFVTSAEWLDVNYGASIRSLLLNQLGGQSLQLIDPRAIPFDDAMSTAVITCFEVGTSPETVRLRVVTSLAELGRLEQGEAVARQSLAKAQRWTPLLRAGDELPAEDGTMPLGTVARVHRGLVTGANDYFVLSRERARALGIEEWCRPAVTSAKEILQAGGIIRNAAERRLLLDVPATIDRRAYPCLDAYLRLGEQRHGGEPAICERYIPSHRRPWWYLGPGNAAPIIATYMARQAPVFALNPDALALINIGHGIYPMRALMEVELAALVGALNTARESFRGGGRTYQGGLEKFEPREMESLRVPRLDGEF